MRRTAPLLLLLLPGLVVLTGCSRFGLRRDQKYGDDITKMAVEKVPVHGFRVRVIYRVEKDRTERAKGELLAIDRESLFLKAKREILRIPRWSIIKVKTQLYDSAWGSMLGWSLSGMIFSGSHGMFMVISVPIWLVAIPVTTTLVAFEGGLTFERKDLDKLYQYARFPAGLPKGFQVTPLGAVWAPGKKTSSTKDARVAPRPPGARPGTGKPTSLPPPARPPAGKGKPTSRPLPARPPAGKGKPTSRPLPARPSDGKGKPTPSPPASRPPAARPPGGKGSPAPVGRREPR